MVKVGVAGAFIAARQDKIERFRSADFPLAYAHRGDVTNQHLSSHKVTGEYYGGHRTTTVDAGGHDDYGMPFVDLGRVAADDDGCERCDTVQRSNFRVLMKINESMEVNGDRPAFTTVGYGRTTYLGAFIDDLDNEMIDTLIGLREQYPILDEEDLSELEHEEITASWDAYLRSDLYLAMDRLRGRTGSLRLIWDHLGEEAVERLFWDAVQDERFGGMIPTHDGRDVVWGGQDNMVKIFREVLIRAYWDRRKGCSLCGSDSDECMQGCRHQGEAVNG